MDSHATTALAVLGSIILAQRLISTFVLPRFSQLAQLPGPPSANALLGVFASLEDPTLLAQITQWTATYGETYRVAGILGANIVVVRLFPRVSCRALR
jgi:hypothetical protein